MTTLLAAVDNSAASCPVISAATALARVLGATVEAVHVAEDGSSTARGAADALSVPFRSVRGEPLEQLLHLIAAREVVGAAIGVRGLPGSHRPMGHLAVELADRSEKPLLLVPPEAELRDELQRVLIAMEGTASRPRRLGARCSSSTPWVWRWSSSTSTMPLVCRASRTRCSTSPTPMPTRSSPGTRAVCNAPSSSSVSAIQPTRSSRPPRRAPSISSQWAGPTAAARAGRSWPGVSSSAAPDRCSWCPCNDRRRVVAVHDQSGNGGWRSDSRRRRAAPRDPGPTLGPHRALERRAGADRRC